MKNLLVALLLLAPAFSTFAQSYSVCSSEVTRELEACQKGNLDLSDKKLNEIHKTIHQKLNRQDRYLITNTQRHWVKYRDKTCQAAFDLVSPGQEATLEKLICLDDITRARTRELQYLDCLATWTTSPEQSISPQSITRMEIVKNLSNAWQVNPLPKMKKIGSPIFKKIAN